jgi:hypothetical protein
MIGQICHVVFLSSHGSISFIFLAAIGEVVVPIVHLPVQSVHITTNGPAIQSKGDKNISIT